MSSGVYLNLKRELDKGKRAVMITQINECDESRSSPFDKMILTEEQLGDTDNISQMDSATVSKARAALETGKLQYFQGAEGVSILAEPYFPRPRLIVLGGGQIAKPITEFGAKVGFLVTVVDERPMFANKDRFPYADKVICERLSDCFTQFYLNEYSFVVIVTREHRQDLDCLKQVLNYNTAYIGMIGSKQSVNGVKEQLLKKGCPEELVNKVHAPIGLEIGADTPEEIAISIIAQVIRCRRLIEASTEDRTLVKANWLELDESVLEALCRDTGEPRALVTIIDTKGSVPRKAGTKMLVWSYGMTAGSIGGGYAEGEVINAAWQIIGSGGLKIQDIEMTGQIAEEEGMVCGGFMRVLIEDYH
jgi:xanthine dehydrogenase accessory factor